MCVRVFEVRAYVWVLEVPAGVCGYWRYVKVCARIGGA